MSSTERKERALAHVVATPAYRSEYAGWLFANWMIYEEFERMALFSAKKGRDRLSAKLLCEQIRWNSALREDGPYKVNNLYSPDLARLFDFMNPAHAGLFEFRRRMAAV